MIKKILLVLFLIMAVPSLIAQTTIKGVIKDKYSNELISHATISSDDGKWVTISNKEGSFRLTVPEGTKAITINYLGYTTVSFAVAAASQDGVYFLEPRAMELDEIIILNIPVHTYLKKLIENSTSRLTTPMVLSTYYREFVNLNNKYAKYADGLIDYNITRVKDKPITQMAIKQSRAVKFEDADEEHEMIKVIGPEVSTAVANDYAFVVLSNLLFKKKGYKNYDYLVKSQNTASGELQVITFTPKPDVDQALYDGTVVYDPATNLILAINMKMAPKYAGYSRVRNYVFFKLVLTDMAYACNFKINDGSYLLSTSSLYAAGHLFNKSNLSKKYRFKSDMVVTNYTTDATAFNKNKKSNLRTLYENGTNYKEKFWLKNNAIVLTAEEEAIIKSLEGEN